MEYLLHYISKYKKYQCHLKKPYIPTYSSLSIYSGNERKIRREKALNSFPLANEETLFDQDGFLKNESLNQIEGFIETAKHADPDFHVYLDVYAFIN